MGVIKNRFPTNFFWVIGGKNSEKVGILKIGQIETSCRFL